MARFHPATLLVLTALCAVVGALLPHSLGMASTTTARTPPAPAATAATAATAKRTTAKKTTARAADASSCPGATLMPDGEDHAAVRTATLCLINRERGEHGEIALEAVAALENSAQEHTDSMVSAHYFEHIGPNGETPLSRMRAVGYISNSRDGYVIGENIAWGTLWLATPRAIVAAWMASPGHRANILNARFRQTGIGVSPHVPASMSGGQAGAIYTQDFGAIITG